MGSLLGYAKGEGPFMDRIRDHNRCHYYALSEIRRHVPVWRRLARVLGWCRPWDAKLVELMYSADRGLYQLFYHYAKSDHSRRGEDGKECP